MQNKLTTAVLFFFFFFTLTLVFGANSSVALYALCPNTKSHGKQQNIKCICQPIFIITSFIECYNGTRLSVANEIT